MKPTAIREFVGSFGCARTIALFALVVFLPVFLSGGRFFWIKDFMTFCLGYPLVAGSAALIFGLVWGQVGSSFGIGRLFRQRRCFQPVLCRIWDHPLFLGLLGRSSTTIFISNLERYILTIMPTKTYSLITSSSPWRPR